MTRPKRPDPKGKAVWSLKNPGSGEIGVVVAQSTPSARALLHSATRDPRWENAPSTYLGEAHGRWASHVVSVGQAARSLP